MARTTRPLRKLPQVSTSRRLREQIIAVLALAAHEPPLSAGAIAQRTPLAEDPHEVSQRLYEMVRDGLVQRIGPAYGRPGYRLAPKVRPSNAAVETVTAATRRKSALT